MPKINFSTIDHKVRVELDLGLLEYCLADLIYHLGNNPRSTHQGWCYAKKQTLAENLSTSRRHTHRLLNKLEKKGLIEIDLETNFVRTTVKWYDLVIITRTVMSHSVTKGHTERDKMSHPIYDNNTDNDIKEIYKEKKSENSKGKKYSLVSDLTEEDLLDIKQDYGPPMELIRNNLERLKNYSKSYKNYKSALRNWVLMDMERLKIPLKKKTPPEIEIEPVEPGHKISRDEFIKMVDDARKKVKEEDKVENSKKEKGGLKK